jgi:hypothetical protein
MDGHRHIYQMKQLSAYFKNCSVGAIRIEELTRRKTLLCMVVTCGEGPPVRKHSICPACFVWSVAPSLFLFPDRFPRAWHMLSRDTAHRANQTAETDCAIGERRDKALSRTLTFIFLSTIDVKLVRCEDNQLAC